MARMKMNPMMKTPSPTGMEFEVSAAAMMRARERTRIWP